VSQKKFVKSLGGSNLVEEPHETLDRLARLVIGSAIEVHRILGPGFLETVYEEALALELARRSIPFERQVPMLVHYKGVPVGQARADLVVDQRLIVELKAVEQLAPVHLAQVIAYLRAFQCPLGLLITFNVRLLREGVRRVVLTHF
jgi:GxxExxY protein